MLHLYRSICVPLCFLDYDECEFQSPCVDGACVNTAGSFNCFCSPPLVLDSTQRRCIGLNTTEGVTHKHIWSYCLSNYKNTINRMRKNRECVKKCRERNKYWHIHNWMWFGFFFCILTSWFFPILLVFVKSSWSFHLETLEPNHDVHMDICWQRLEGDQMCAEPLQGRRTTYTECCCLYGIAWSGQCAFCPRKDSGE